MAGQTLVVERIVNGQRDRLGEWRLPIADDVRLENVEVDVEGGTENQWVVTWYGPQSEMVVEEEVSPGVIVKREFTEDDQERAAEAGVEFDDDGFAVSSMAESSTPPHGAGPADPARATVPAEGSVEAHEEAVAEEAAEKAEEAAAATEAAVEGDEDEEEVLTGDALKARAAELEIEGRSTMTADELRDAIAEAEAEEDDEEDEE